jgi:carbamoyl-phosphate synthase large subunit
MQVIYNERELRRYMNDAEAVSADSPLLLDHFLDNAIEVDVDAISDGKDILIGGVMEHIEQAGVHSGDSACCLPPHSLPPEIQDKLRAQMRKMALELGVVGLMNAQFAIQDNEVYILEVNPRASRTVPFVAKATGVPLAKIAARCMVGIPLKEQGFLTEVIPEHYAVKQPVFPFAKFPGADPILGPEMRSTGEVMGVGNCFAEAFAKAQLGADNVIPKQGTAFLSVRDADKHRVIDLAQSLIELGFNIVATAGTAEALQKFGIQCELVYKVNEGRPHIVDMLKNDQIDFIVNTTEGEHAIADSFAIRRNAVQHKVCYYTTVAGGKAACASLRYDGLSNIFKLQDLHTEP